MIQKRITHWLKDKIMFKSGKIKSPNFRDI